MNNLSWPATILIGILLGLIAVAAGNGETRGDDPTASPSESPSASPGAGGGSGSDDSGGGSGSGGDSGSGSGSGDSDGGDSDGETNPDTGGDAEDYTVTLTFDDGPHPVYTPQVLDLLEKHDAIAVFCMVGQRVREHPEVVRQVVDAGHALCNHTDTHDEQLSARTREQIEQQIDETDEALDDAVGGDTEVRWFRQPGTYVEPQLAPILDERDLEPLDWTLDPRDWSRPGATSIVQDVLGHVEPGSVILLHDGGGDRSQTVAALDQILTGLDAAGYRYVLPGDS
ncbi:polysaccharide deacetylase family protein [Jiangella alkaliphila]|uniref:Polysaccharide deacetylase n=1 Tax=Jiangella alkaliphila TaxID=419479 RepID=A0A1H2KVZ5_9ACTN|nr:polysaccharide deacetylase family protein [Jiangella alkaliphila]SDU72588.1 Polysaccharide deacetylase [Jiangella alkaliphila]